MDYEMTTRREEMKESAHGILVAVLLTAHSATLVQGGYGELFHNLIGALAVLEGSITLYKMSGWRLSTRFSKLRLIHMKKEKTPTLQSAQKKSYSVLSASQQTEKRS